MPTEIEAFVNKWPWLHCATCDRLLLRGERGFAVRSFMRGQARPKGPTWCYGHRPKEVSGVTQGVAEE